MTTTAPTVNGRGIALVHDAGRALVERVMAQHGATFHQSVAPRAVVVAGKSIGRDELVGEPC